MLIMIVILAAVQPSSAQMTKQIGISAVYDDNAFRNYAGISDYNTHLNWYLANDFVGDSWEHRFFYQGYTNMYKRYASRFSHYHRFGYIAATSLFAESNIVNIGVNLTFNRRTVDYNYANYTQGLGYLNYKLWLRDNMTLHLGHRTRFRDYHYLPELTYLENKTFARLSWFLPTKTSLLCYSAYGHKNYNTMPAAQDDDIAQTLLETPPLRQVQVSLRIGQALTAKTGISLQYLRRLNLSKQDYFGEIQYASLIKEEDIFDDPYSYHGHEFSAAMTRLLPWSMTFKTGFDHYLKTYLSEALDLDGYPVEPATARLDTRQIIWFTLRKTFPKTSFLKNMILSLDYYYLRNHSNDSYFDYDNSIIGMGTDFSF
jgi:hypothetical protein